MKQEDFRFEVAKLWKALLGAFVMQIGIANHAEDFGSIIIEPLSINALLIHLKERSLALHMNLETAEGTWIFSEKEKTQKDGVWALVPQGILIDTQADPIAPLTAAESFITF